jgi:hypothetical protein
MKAMQLRNHPTNQKGKIMTTTVKVSAHLADTKEVQVLVSGQMRAVLQDGESTEVYAYDNRVIQVREVLKSDKVPPSMQKPFRFDLGDTATIKVSGEQGEVIGRAQYTDLPNYYQLRYKNAAGVASEQWWEDSTLA